MEYVFWTSSNYGMIRQRRTPDALYHPEIWRDGGWVTGTEYVMDAISGMGEDVWSCGEMAFPMELPEAETYAEEHGIELFG